MSPDSTVGDAPAKLDTGTNLAYQRTFLAHERTEMSWVRTALSFITFGFSVSKFFELLRDKSGEHGPFFGPQQVGVLMIAIGLISMGVATVFHARSVKELRAKCPELPRSPIGVVAFLIFVLGILAMVGVLVR